MIIVRLKGGLGNQMFQYAAARRLAEKLNTSLKLDISFFRQDTMNETKREFELDKFNIRADFLSAEEFETFKGKKKTWRDFYHPKYIREKHFRFLKPFLRSDNDYYLNGYWQSDKYFADIDAIIRKEFEFREAVTDEYFIRIQEKILSSNSVSLHFRRGDYVSDSRTNKYHGTCSLEYYQNALKIIADKVSNPQLFAFSDDLEWVKSNFHTNFPIVFVEKKDEILHSDFRLMTMCKHNIIANSSYSWWAAWLNLNQEKNVITPKQWFKNKRKQYFTTDNVPTNWLKVK